MSRGLGDVYKRQPLYAVSSKYDTYKELGQAYFTLEGSKDHLQEMRDMLQDAGCKVIVMDSEINPCTIAALWLSAIW